MAGSVSQLACCACSDHQWACWGEQGWGSSLPPVLLQTITEAAEANKATLFFCKIGKDRTGVLAAMLLSCCGATRQEIIDDYVK